MKFRTVKRWVAAVAAVGLLAAVPAVPASADELSDAVARLTRLQEEASDLGERYVEANNNLAAARAKVAALSRDVAAQQAKVDDLTGQAARIALDRFRDRNVDRTAELFTAPNPDRFLAGLSTVGQVEAHRDLVTTDFIVETAVLKDRLREQQAAADALAAEVERVAGLKAEVDEKVEAADRLVAELTAAELARVNGGAFTSFDPDSLDLGGVDARVARAVRYAVEQTGKRYVWAAEGPDSFDCSGLMMVAFAQAGVRLPHSSLAQSKLGAPVARTDLRPGDMIFWYDPVHHVGMYIGDGLFVHARNPQAGVVVQPVNSYPVPITAIRRVLG